MRLPHFPHRASALSLRDAYLQGLTVWATSPKDRTTMSISRILAIAAALICLMAASCRTGSQRLPREPSITPAEESQQIKVVLDIRQTIRILYPSQEHFFVVIENVSSKPVYLATMNGVMHWVSFEITDENGEKTVVHRAVELTSKTVDYDVPVAPGEASVLEVYFMRQRDWEAFPLPKFPLSRKWKIRAICDIPASFRHPSSWTGKVVSGWYEVTVENYDKPPGKPLEARSIGVAINTGVAYGWVNVNVAADGQEGNLYLKSLSIVANGAEWPIPGAALEGIQRPILSGGTVMPSQNQTNENRRFLFDVAIDLGKPPSYTGDWKRHRVHFVFEGGKFQKRYTTVEEEKVLDEWRP